MVLVQLFTTTKFCSLNSCFILNTFNLRTIMESSCGPSLNEMGSDHHNKSVYALQASLITVFLARAAEYSKVKILKPIWRCD